MVKIKSFQRYISVIILAVTVLSCSSTADFEDYKFVGNGWHKDSSAVFNVDIVDTLSTYNILVDTRNTNAYPYANLWLFVKITAPDSNVMCDTVEFQLSNIDGKWLGKGAGSLYDLQQPYRNNIFFPKAGRYTISLTQGMRDNSLPGINDIGIRIERN